MSESLSPDNFEAFERLADRAIAADEALAVALEPKRNAAVYERIANTRRDIETVREAYWHA